MQTPQPHDAHRPVAFQAQQTPHPSQASARHDLARWCRHLGTTRAHAHWCFPEKVLDALEAAIRTSEAQHRCEIRLVIEAAMPLTQVWHGQTCRHRALHLFHQLGIAHTDERTGILLYINIADHDIEIVADHGVNRHVAANTWDSVVAHLVDGFQHERYLDSTLAALDELCAIARRHLPAHMGRQPDNALTDRPLIL